jgi:hypothetical protein
MHSRWRSRQALGLHLTLAILLPTFAVLCIWQVHRALSGNELSWAYVFEWPLFAGYAVFVWWRLIHDDKPVRGVRPKDSAKKASTSIDTTGGPDPNDKGDEDLAAYNEYLAQLNQNGPRKRW